MSNTAAIQGGTINVSMILNSDAFNQAVGNTARSSETKMKGSMNKIKGFAAAAFSIGVIVDFAKEIGKVAGACIEVASSLAEVNNVVNTAMPSMNRQFEKFAQTAAKTYGLSELQAKRMGGTFASMANSFGFTEEQAYKMATSLTGLAGDVGSFYNINAEQAQTKLKSVFTGETESLKELGVVMTQTALNDYAMQKGMSKTVQQMSEQEKVALRYSFVMDKLSLAQGDFSKTQDSWANQTRILSLQLESLKANLGAVFIQVLTPCLKLLNSFLDSLVKVTAKLKEFLGVTVEDSVSGAGAVATDQIDAIGEATKEASEEVKGGLSDLDDVTILNSGDSETATTGNAGTVDIPEIGDTGATESSGIKLAEILDMIKDKAKEVKDLFMEGFNARFDSNGLDFQKHLDSIKKSLKNIFDKEVQNRAAKSLKTMIKSWGEIAGSAANIGATVAEFLVGSIAKFLSQNTGIIKTQILRSFDIMDKINTLSSDVINAIDRMFRFFRGENAQQVGADLLAIFTIPFMQITLLAAQAGLDIMNALVLPFINNADLISQTLDNFLGGVQPVVTAIKDFIIGALETVWQTYEEHIKPFIDTAGEVLSSLFETILNGWNEYMAPVVENLSRLGKEVIEEKVKPAWDALWGAIGAVFDLGVAILKNWIEPLLTKLIDFLYPILSKIYEFVGKYFIAVLGTLSDTFKFLFDVIKTVIDVFTDLINNGLGPLKQDFIDAKDLIVELFGNIAEWFKEKFNAAVKAIKDAFSGVGKFFSGIWDSIKNTFAKVAEWFKEKFNSASKAVETAFSGIAKFFSGIWDSIKNTFSKVADWFKDIFSKAWDNIKNAFSGATQFFSNIWDSIKNTFNSVSDWFKGKFNSASQGVKDAFNGISQFFSGIWESIKNIFAVVSDWFKEKFNAAVTNVKTTFGGVTQFFSDVWEGIKKPFAKVADWFKDIFSKAWENVKNVFCSGGRIFTGIKDGIADVFKTVVNKLIDGINTVISKPIDKINDALRTIKNINIVGKYPFKWLPTITAPTIPKMYAEGWGAFKPNQPQLVGVGDNRRENEYILLQSQMQKIINSAVSQSNRGKQSLESNVQVNIGGERIYGNVEDYFRIQDKRAGKMVFV